MEGFGAFLTIAGQNPEIFEEYHLWFSRVGRATLGALLRKPADFLMSGSDPFEYRSAGYATPHVANSAQPAIRGPEDDPQWPVYADGL